MGFYDNPSNVDDYIKNAKGIDGRALMPILTKYAKPGGSVLELGMGPGKDVRLLQKAGFSVTGSDSSRVFVDLFARDHPETDLLLLDAVAIKTSRRFDCVYSNKVLMHFDREELEKSLLRQLQLLNPNGIAFHTFWVGEGSEDMDGLHFEYYQPADLEEIAGNYFKVEECGLYKESAKGDSIYIVLRKS